MRKLFISLGLVVAVAVSATPGISQADYIIEPGFDLFKTVTANINLPGLGIVPFQGVPLVSYDFEGSAGVKNTGNTDTIVERINQASVAGPAQNDVIAIEIVALQLKSVNQINLGAGLGYHYATLQSASTSSGTADINFISQNAGVFDSNFTVYFDIRFGSLTGTILASASKTFTATNVPWAREPIDDLAIKIPTVNYLLNGSTPDRDFWPPTAQHDAGDGSQHNVSTGISIVIPTVSEWGLIIMAVLLLTVGAVAIQRRFKTVPA